MKTINALRYENLGVFILYKSKTKYSNIKRRSLWSTYNR